MSRVGNHEPNFALMNILTGICVNNANRAAEEDFDLSMHEERSKHRQIVESLKERLRNADVRGAGTIAWSDLDMHLRDKQVRSLFKKIDLEPWHLKNFFDMMGAGDDAEACIDIDQFIRGCFRLRSSVKNIDLVASRHDEAELSAKRLQEIKESLDQLRDVIMQIQSQTTLLSFDQPNGHASRSHWHSLVSSSRPVAAAFAVNGSCPLVDRV